MAKNLYGSLGRLTSILFRKNSQDITLQPNASTTFTAARAFSLPNINADETLAGISATQTLTNKTLNLPTVEDELSLVPTSPGAAPTLKLYENSANGSNFALLAAPDALSASISLILPATDGTLALDSNATLTNMTIDDSTLTNAQLEGGVTTIGLVTAASDTGNQARIRLAEDLANGSSYVELKAPAALGGNLDFILPATAGSSGNVLSTDGSGVTSWISAASVPAAGAVYSNGSALQTTGAFTGNANELVGVNSGETATEYKALATGTSGTDFNIAHAAGSITLNIPDASGVNRGFVTPGPQTFGGEKEFTSQIKISSGTAAEPGLVFSADDDTSGTGIYRSAANTLDVSTNGTSRFSISTTATTSTLPVIVPNGTAGAPGLTFSGANNLGWYYAGSDTLAASTAGSVRATINGAGTMNVGTSSMTGTPLSVQRSGDGTLVDFIRNASSEGSISVAVSTVSYNAFMGAHWTTLDVPAETPEGTILSTVDEMTVWPGDPVPDRRHPKAKISDVSYDTAVYGVFHAVDEEGDLRVAALGAYVVRVNTQGGDIQVGDLIVTSSTPGVGMKQNDGIIRSCTVAKARQSWSGPGEATIAATIIAG